MLAVGIFANGSYGAGWNGSDVDAGVEGIIKGDVGPARRPGCSARSSSCTVIFGIAFAFFKIQNALTKGGIRPTTEDEIAGLDLPGDGRARLPGVPGLLQRGREQRAGRRSGLIQGNRRRVTDRLGAGSGSFRVPRPVAWGRQR